VADDLRELAHKLFLLTRRDVWAGGIHGGRGEWPGGVERVDWNHGTFWTLSPEVQLGGYRLRVCVSSQRVSVDSNQEHRVRVYVDGEIKHPGGMYDERELSLLVMLGLAPESWATIIARQEREDGGRTGPVDVRDLLIAEAADKLNGVRRAAEPAPDEAAIQAAREVEALLKPPVRTRIRE
jgi:hypothetical protein